MEPRFLLAPERGAYGYVDAKLVGSLYGLDNQVEGGWVCAQAAGIEFGRPVFSNVGEERKLYSFLNDVGQIVFDGDFVAANSIIITVNGVDTDPVVFDTDHDTTAGLVVDAINALSGVKAVLAAADTDNRTFQIQTAGATAVVAEAITGGAGQVTGTVTYTTSQVFVGISIRTQNAPGLYEQYDAVNVLIRGNVIGTASTAVLANNEAYVYNVAGDDLGKFANSGLEINARYRDTLTAAGLARLEVNGQKELSLAGTFANV